MKVELLAITPDAEKLIERAGRICYASEDKITDDSHEGFIQGLIKRGHDSVLEHASATFHIKGISRACSHQLVRHRLASFSQQTQRYVEQKFSCWIEPKTIQENERARYREAIDIAWFAYESMVEAGVPKEDARMILPQCGPTELVMTANLREWRHIFQLRCNKAAQWEIRELCLKSLHILQSQCPNVFGDFEVDLKARTAEPTHYF